jgi:hypothetical protein
MEDLAKKYQGRADFVFIYCVEAHPEGDALAGKSTKEGQAIPQARTIEERKQAAKMFCEDMKLARRILLDEFEDKSVHRRYAARANPTIVVDRDGRIALKMAWTHGESLDKFLDKFLAGGGKFNRELAQSVPLYTPHEARGTARGNRVSETMRQEMMARLLEGLDLNETEAAAARAILPAKAEARASLRDKAEPLNKLARQAQAAEGDLAKAIKEFEAAVADCQKAAVSLDRQFTDKVSIRGRALLLTAGVFENGLGNLRSGPRQHPPPEMMVRLLEGLDLTDSEKAAGTAILKAKAEARSKLRKKLDTLGELARDGKAAEAALAQAIKEVEEAVADYQKTMAALDRKLSEQVSTRSKARLLVAGIFENGFGNMRSRPPAPKDAGTSGDL